MSTDNTPDDSTKRLTELEGKFNRLAQALVDVAHMRSDRYVEELLTAATDIKPQQRSPRVGLSREAII